MCLATSNPRASEAADPVSLEGARLPASRLYLGSRYLLYALLNALHVLNIAAIVLLLPAIFFSIKTLACGYCAYYAFQIRGKIAGAQQIP